MIQNSYKGLDTRGDILPWGREENNEKDNKQQQKQRQQSRVGAC